MGSRKKKIVCFQCVGIDAGPVLKLVTFGRPVKGPPELIRRPWYGRPPSGQISARTGSPSWMTCTSTSSGIGSPVLVKKVSK